MWQVQTGTDTRSSISSSSGEEFSTDRGESERDGSSAQRWIFWQRTNCARWLCLPTMSSPKLDLTICSTGCQPLVLRIKSQCRDAPRLCRYLRLQLLKHRSG